MSGVTVWRFDRSEIAPLENAIKMVSGGTHHVRTSWSTCLCESWSAAHEPGCCTHTHQDPVRAAVQDQAPIILECPAACAAIAAGCVRRRHVIHMQATTFAGHTTPHCAVWTQSMTHPSVRPAVTWTFFSRCRYRSWCCGWETLLQQPKLRSHHPDRTTVHEKR